MTTTAHDDAYSILQCLAGNADAFEPLVRRYQNAAFAVAMGFLRDRTDAEDVVQDAFVAAYCKLSQLKDPSVFGSWLHRIVVNCCKEWRRRQKVSHLVRIDPESEHNRGEYPQANRIHRNYIESLELWDEVDRLPEHYRRVVNLYYYTGFTLKEIAAFLDIPESTVKGRLYQSRIRLKNALSSQEQETLVMSQIDVTEDVQDVLCKIAREDFEEKIDMGDVENIVLYCGVNTEVEISQAEGDQVVIKGSKIALGLTEEEARGNLDGLHISHDQVENYLETGPHDGALFLGVKSWFPDNVPYTEPISKYWRRDLENESMFDERLCGVKMVDALPDSKHEINLFLPLPEPSEKSLRKSMRITVHASEARPIRMTRDAVSDKVERIFRSMQSDSTRVYGPATYCHVSVSVPAGMNISVFRSDRVNVDGLDGSLMAYACSTCRVNEITGDVFLFNSNFSEIRSVDGSLFQRMYGYGDGGCSLDNDTFRRNPYQNEGIIESVKGGVDIDVGCMNLSALDLEGDIAIYNRYGCTRLSQGSRNIGHRCYVRSVSGDVGLMLDESSVKNTSLVMHTICGVAKYGELKKRIPVISSWPHNEYWMSFATTQDLSDPDITVITESGTVEFEVTKNGKHH
ncbi:MAG: sigma-70 family RNA polymerase sigma factor [Gemmatimonadetes bacterium]|nr:sigma-70 family RNA polymerase sigma factor [Gemmatimonadota bacterium]MYD24485.1 sigma-70 family RNA polymerase sigma factor [Gemmatimonadota bacterium]